MVNFEKLHCSTLILKIYCKSLASQTSSCALFPLAQKRGEESIALQGPHKQTRMWHLRRYSTDKNDMWSTSQSQQGSKHRLTIKKKVVHNTEQWVDMQTKWRLAACSDFHSMAWAISLEQSYQCEDIVSMLSPVLWNFPAKSSGLRQAGNCSYQTWEVHSSHPNKKERTLTQT